MNAPRRVARARTKRDAIRAIYAAVEAPKWAATNLDGLADVLRDLSWLPEGPVILEWSVPTAAPAADARALRTVLDQAIADSAGSRRPLQLRIRR
ncbi:MAG: barstar family protein [Actinomycetota bacterium]